MNFYQAKQSLETNGSVRVSRVKASGRVLSMMCHTVGELRSFFGRKNNRKRPIAVPTQEERDFACGSVARTRKTTETEKVKPSQDNDAWEEGVIHGGR